MRDKVSIFIDGSNFYHALREVYGRVDLDFEAFVSLFSVSSTGVTRTLNPVHYYNSVIDRGKHPKTYARQQKFFAHLQQIANPVFKIYRGQNRPPRKPRIQMQRM